MTMEGSGNAIGPLIDADGHVLEPADTWQNYIDPKFQDRAIRIELDADGRERLLFDNKPFEFLKGNLGGLGGIDLEKGGLGLQTRDYTYAEGSPPGGYDPAARIEVLDQEGIDRVLLYPTIGICWEGNVSDPLLATAYTRRTTGGLLIFAVMIRNGCTLSHIFPLSIRKGPLKKSSAQEKRGAWGSICRPTLRPGVAKRLSIQHSIFFGVPFRILRCP